MDTNSDDMSLELCPKCQRMHRVNSSRHFQYRQNNQKKIKPLYSYGNSMTEYAYKQDDLGYTHNG